MPKLGYKRCVEHQIKLNQSHTLPRESRFCECKCGKTFICRVNSTQRFISGHNTKLRTKEEYIKIGKKVSKSKIGHVVILETRERIKLKLKGHISLRKGLTNVEYYGLEKAESISTKIREKRVKQKFPFTNTSIEVALQKQLKIKDIDFITNYYKLKGTPDIFIESNNVNYKGVCIFADGDYWHSRHGAQQYDKQINEYLFCKGYKVLRFWEKDIKQDINKCINIIEINL